MTFHATGLATAPDALDWRPPPNGPLVVISPFVTAEALQALARTTREPLALISRAEQLAALPAAALEPFTNVFVLDEAAEVEDGEDVVTYREPRMPLRGLHVKAHIYEAGWCSRIALGSANATNSALLAGRNVELMAELVGRHARVGRPRGIRDVGKLRSVHAWSRSWGRVTNYDI